MKSLKYLHQPFCQVGNPDHFNYPTGAGLIRAKEAAARVADISIQGKVFEDFGPEWNTRPG